MGRVLGPVWFTPGLKKIWASGSIARKAGSMSIEEMFASAHVSWGTMQRARVPHSSGPPAWVVTDV